MDIKIHKELENILQKIVDKNGNRVAKCLLAVSKDGIKSAINLETGDSIQVIKDETPNYFKISDYNKNQISFINPDKMRNYGDKSDEELWGDEGIRRTRTKPGKILKKIFTDEILESFFGNVEIERFINSYRSEIEQNIDIKVVKGSDILKYYLQDHYAQGDDIPEGTLWSSCMMHQSKQEFLKIYEDNDNISMLIALDTNENLLGRAIVWDGVELDIDYNGQYDKVVTFMDRIYYTHEWIVDKFREYAKNEGWWSKKRQSFDSYKKFMSPEGEYFEANARVKLESIFYHRYPYIDTLFEPDYENKYLSNVDRECSLHFREYSAGIPENVWDNVENKLIPNWEATWSSDIKSWIPNSKLVEDDGLFHMSKSTFDPVTNKYYRPQDKIKCLLSGKECPERNLVDSKYHGGKVHKDLCVEVKDDYVSRDKAVWSKYFKTYCLEEKSTYIEEIGDNLPNEVLESIDEDSVIKIISLMNSYGTFVDKNKDKLEYTFEF